MTGFQIRATLMLVTVALAASAPGAAAAAPITSFESCRDAVVLVPGVEERVRSRVPARFELIRDVLGRPLLFAFTGSCQRYPTRRTTRPTKYGFFVAIIKSPDGAGCLSRWPAVGTLKGDAAPLCSFYFLSGGLDHPDVVAAYKSAFPEFALRYVPDLVFQIGAFDLLELGSPLSFRAGRPMPSPFSVDAAVREEPVRGPATFIFYGGSAGSALGRMEIHDMSLSPTPATLRVAAQSELAYLLGTDTPRAITGIYATYPRGRMLPAG